MLIDMQHLSVKEALLTHTQVTRLYQFIDKNFRANGYGEITNEYQVPTPSDSGKVILARDRFHARFVLSGSPAHVLGDSVMGKGPAATLNLRGCAEALLGAYTDSRGDRLIDIVPLEKWRQTKADITRNLWVPGGRPGVRQRLERVKLLRLNGRLPTAYANTTYHFPSSDVRTLKTYAKGQQLRRAVRAERAEATHKQMVLADSLLRLELELKHGYWSAIADPWAVTPAQLRREHQKEYETMLDALDDTIEPKTVREAIAAEYGKNKTANLFHAYLAIRLGGWEHWRDNINRRTAWRITKDLQKILPNIRAIPMPDSVKGMLHEERLLREFNARQKGKSHTVPTFVDTWEEAETLSQAEKNDSL